MLSTTHTHKLHGPVPCQNKCLCPISKLQRKRSPSALVLAFFSLPILYFFTKKSIWKFMHGLVNKKTDKPTKLSNIRNTFLHFAFIEKCFSNHVHKEVISSFYNCQPQSHVLHNTRSTDSEEPLTILTAYSILNLSNSFKEKVSVYINIRRRMRERYTF